MGVHVYVEIVLALGVDVSDTYLLFYAKVDLFIAYFYFICSLSFS